MAGAQRSLSASFHPCHSLFCPVHTPKQHIVLIKLKGVFRWLEIVSCLVTPWSSNKSLEIYGSKIVSPHKLWLDLTLTHPASCPNSPSSHGDLRSEEDIAVVTWPSTGSSTSGARSPRWSSHQPSSQINGQSNICISNRVSQGMPSWLSDKRFLNGFS